MGKWGGIGDSKRRAKWRSRLSIKAKNYFILLRYASAERQSNPLAQYSTSSLNQSASTLAKPRCRSRIPSAAALEKRSPKITAIWPKQSLRKIIWLQPYRTGQSGSRSEPDGTGPRLKDLLLAQEFKRIARCLCWLCMKGFPERWIIILRAVYPWRNFPLAHLIGRLGLE